ncbi:MAG TPA: 2,3-butanediol dehydrogenase [Dehalococcoidales bacterium]|nr:2,3-butanediol dehydrogenase [Dehalococcoidales bacterium]
MKALRWYARKDLRYEDVPEPSPGPGQLKIKVALAGICGTDLKEYAYGPVLIPPAKVPLTMGHEFAGTVAAVGKGVKGFKVGDRVSGVGNYYCGECYVCKKGLYNLCVNQIFTGIHVDGCMAEYFVLPTYACYKLPNSVSDELGALVEPLAVALHAVSQAHVNPGDTVAIVGDGAIGLCSLLAAKSAGASEVYVIAKHKGRGGLAAKLGATAVIYSGEGNPIKKLQELTGGIGTDAAIECVGRPETPQLAVECTRRGGIAVIVGIFEKPGMIDFSTITFTEKTMVGSSIYVHEGRTAIDLMADKRIDPSPLISSVVPLKDAAKNGFEELINNKEANIKVLLQVA